jgi:hypothetical protein
LHFTRQDDHCYIHHVPNTTTSIFLSVLGTLFAKDPLLSANLLIDFLTEVSDLHWFSHICFWYVPDNNHETHFLLLDGEDGLTSWNATEGAGPFSVIVDQLPALNLPRPKDGTYRYSHMDLFVLSSWPELHSDSVSKWPKAWLQSFCDKTSFLDAAVSYGGLSMPLSQWFDVNIHGKWLLLAISGQHSFDYVGYIAEMILGYAGHGVDLNSFGVQFNDGIIIPNWAMVGNTLKEGYGDSSTKRESSWSYDYVSRHVENSSLLKASLKSMRDPKNDEVHFYREKFFKSFWLGRTRLPDTSDSNESDDELSRKARAYKVYKTSPYPFAVEYFAWYLHNNVTGSLLRVTESRHRFVLGLAHEHKRIDPRSYYRGTLRNDLLSHIGCCTSQTAWMDAYILHLYTDKVHARLSSLSNRFYGNISNTKVLAAAQEARRSDDVTSITCIVFGNNHFRTIHIRKVPSERFEVLVYCFDTLKALRPNVASMSIFSESAPAVHAAMQITNLPKYRLFNGWRNVNVFEQPDTHLCGYVSFFVSLYALLNPGVRWENLPNLKAEVLTDHGVRIIRHAFAAVCLDVLGLYVGSFCVTEETTGLPAGVTRGTDITLLPKRNAFSFLSNGHSYDMPPFQTNNQKNYTPLPCNIAEIKLFEGEGLNPLLSRFEHDMSEFLYKHIKDFGLFLQEFEKNGTHPNFYDSDDDAVTFPKKGVTNVVAPSKRTTPPKHLDRHGGNNVSILSSPSDSDDDEPKRLSAAVTVKNREDHLFDSDDFLVKEPLVEPPPLPIHSSVSKAQSRLKLKTKNKSSTVGTTSIATMTIPTIGDTPKGVTSVKLPDVERQSFPSDEDDDLTKQD